MPKNSTQRVGPRSALPPAQTGYEITNAAKGPTPNDPFSATASGPSKANELAQALGVAQTLIPTAVQVATVVKEKRTKQGAEARFAGDALDPNQSDAFIDGYERMDGQYRGIQFGNAAKEYALKNSNLDPIKFQEGLDALQKEYTGKLVHQGQLDTFLPDALKGGEQAASIYQEAKNAEIIHERNAKVTDINKGKAVLTLDRLLADLAGIPLKDGHKSIGTNPEMRARFEAHEEEVRGALAPELRKIMEGSSADYQALGITPREARLNMVNVIGGISADIGANSLNDFLFQKDGSGMSPDVAFPAEVNKHSDSARASGEHISNAMILRAEKAKKAANEKKVGDMLVALADPEVSVDVANKIKMDVTADSTLDASDREKIANHAADVMLGQGYALKDNLKVAGDLEYQIRMGKLSGNKADMAILSAAPKLSLPTVRHLYAIAKEHKDKASDHSWGMFNHEANTHLSGMVKELGLTDDLGRMMINLNIQGQSMLGQVVSNGVSEWFRGVDLLYKQHGGPFDGAELTKLRERITRTYTPQKEAIAKHYLTTGGQGVVGPKSEPSSTLVQPASGVLTNSAVPKGIGITAGYLFTGKTVGGKPAWASPDGKFIEVEK